MSLDNVAAENFVGAYTAVVGPLRSGESVLRPTERVHIVVEQRVFLLDAEPRLLIGCQLHGFKAGVAVVGLGGLLVVLVRVAQDETVVAQVERIAVDGNWVKVDVRVASFSLIGRATVVVPDWQLF